MGWETRRSDPYTEAGVRRIKCVRCQIRKARFQWQICADGNNYRPLCGECDVALNREVLHFMRHPLADYFADKYKKEKLG
jgi:hypothetical protein